MADLHLSDSSAKRIIETTAQRVEVLASPGSGKTYTLIQRIQHLLTIGVLAQHILVLSFSKASVRELQRRMDKLSKTARSNSSLPSSTNISFSGVTGQTAHAFANALLRKQLPNAQLLTDKQAHALLSKAISSVRQDCRKGVLWRAASTGAKSRRTQQLKDLANPAQVRLVLRLLATTSAARAEISSLVSTDQFRSLEPYAKVLVALRKRYASAKQGQQQIDYGDMLAIATKAIKDKTAAVPFTHILVDEYQDCSAAQTHLLTALATLPNRSIMVFGDAHQSIFRFAGTHYTPLSRVLAGVQNLGLPVSHRLTARVAALASAVAQHSVEQVIQTTVDGTRPVVVYDRSVPLQTAHVAGDIQQLIRNGVEPQQIVVLARIKALLAPIEQALLAANVQTSRLGIARDRKHVLNVLRLVRLVEQCQNQQKVVDLAMLRSAMSRLPAGDEKLWKRQSRKLAKVWEVVSLDGRYRLCAAIYLRLLGGIRSDPETRAEVNRWEAWCRGHTDATSVRAAIMAMKPGAVVTGTIHAAKGMEWDHVFIVGATDGLLPLYLSRDEDSLNEERSLLYVAITRARKTVRLYHAPANHARSSHRFAEVSRFLQAPAVHGCVRTIGLA